MLVIGLTGNIASGKTTVAKMFRHLGAEIIDVDKLGHKLLLPEELTWKKVIDSFGKEIMDSHQRINRKRLGQIVFEDSKKLKRLNAIIHPLLIQRVKKEIARLKKEKKWIVIIDAALLIEMSPLFKIVNSLILVKIDKESQMKRLIKSNRRLTRDDVINRIKLQVPQEKKIKLADYVIDNSGTLKKTERQVKKIWKELNI